MYKKLLSQIYIFILFHRNFICPDKSYGKKQVVRIKTTFSTVLISQTVEASLLFPRKILAYFY